MLYVSIILLAALIAVQIAKKSGIPSLMLFLSLGIISSLLGFTFDHFVFAQNFSTVALLIIIFYGGFGTNWKAGKVVMKEALVLSSLGVILTSLLAGICIHITLRFNLMESFLIGSIIGSTDFASVANILSSKNLNLKYHTAPLLELESGSNDPMAFTMTCIFLSLIKGDTISIGLLLFKQIVWGMVIAVFIAFITQKFIDFAELQKSGFISVFIIAIALLSFSLSESLGGNGYLTVYVLGLILGNQTFIAKKEVTFFFDGVSNLMNISLFFLLGMLASPQRIMVNLLYSIIIVLILTFIVRPIVVFLLMIPFKLKMTQKLLICWGGLRGAAAIAFAIMAVNSYDSNTIDIYHIVFGVCLLSSLIQGSLMKWVAMKLNMIDPSNLIKRTFNYYAGKGNITFLKSRIDSGGLFAFKKIEDISLDAHLIIAKVIREDRAIVPRGNLVLLPGDTLVWSGEEYFDPTGHDLLEFTVTENHAWNRKQIKELKLPANQLIISIERNDEIIPAAGNTIIQKEDRILLFKGSEEAGADRRIV